MSLVDVASWTTHDREQENFDSDPFAGNKWVKSGWKDGEMGEWAWTSGEWHTDKDADRGKDTQWHEHDVTVAQAFKPPRI